MAPSPPRQAELDAGERLLTADDRTGQVPEDVSGLSIVELDAAIDLYEAALVLVDGARSMIPDGATRVPDSAFWSQRGRALLATSPGRFERTTLDALHAATKRRRQELIRTVGERRSPEHAARSRSISDMLLDGLRNGPTPEQIARREAEERRQEEMLAEFHAELRAKEAARKAADVAWSRVLAEPGSLRAREALLEDWTKKKDPRAELLEAQLTFDRYRRDGKLGTDEAQALYRKINLMVARDGKRLAGDLGTFVKKVEYFRGLVAGVELSGSTFRSIASMIFDRAPVQHLELTLPLGRVDAIFQVPRLSRLVSLRIVRAGSSFGDAGAKALAASPHVANLRWLDLAENEIGREGVEALTASPYLAKCEFLNLAGNPASTTTVVSGSDGYYSQEVPDIAREMIAKFGMRPWLGPVADPESWPPDRDSFAVTDEAR
ncbi:hypothetical protein L6R52_10930 [Myxococcota bacterium]|nr:hypothetical protein [Myxococcota bacterium]